MRKITANTQKEKGPLNRFFSECIGAGRAAEVMRHVPMKQLQKMQKECYFRYIRFHGIFHEEMDVVRRDENGKLSFCGLAPHTEYTVNAQTIGYRSGDAYNAYLDGNFSELPTREETEMLIKASQPKETVFSVFTDEKGSLSFSIPQMENSVDFLTIEK